MDVGQVKAGNDKEDTYTKMLQEIVRVTAPIAFGIAAKYPSVAGLLRGLKEEGPMALADLKVEIPKAEDSAKAANILNAEISE